VIRRTGDEARGLYSLGSTPRQLVITGLDRELLRLAPVSRSWNRRAPLGKLLVALP